MVTWLAQILAEWDSPFCFSVHYAARHLVCHDGFDHLDVGRPQDDQLLQEMQIGQAVRVDGPQSHLSKAGTPTMGGALIIVAIASAFCFG